MPCSLPDFFAVELRGPRLAAGLDSVYTPEAVKDLPAEDRALAQRIPKDAATNRMSSPSRAVLGQLIKAAL